MDKLNIDIRVDETIEQNKEMLRLIESYQEKISKYTIELEKTAYEDEKRFWKDRIFVYENTIHDLTIVLIKCS